MNSSQTLSVNGHSPPMNSDKCQSRQQIVTNGVDASSAGLVLMQAGDGKYTIAGQNVLQPHEHITYVKAEPGDPMPPLASPAIIDGSVNQHNDQQQLYFISSSDLVQQGGLKSGLQNHQSQNQAPQETGDGSSGSPKHASEQLDHQTEMSSQHQQQVVVSLNGNHSSSQSASDNKQQTTTRQLVVTNGDHTSTGTIVVTEAKEYSINSSQHPQVLQPHEIYIKTEPLDPMPPLASPATVMDAVSTAAVSSSDKNMRDMEASPPATVISLAPAQPYPRGAQLTFATPAYDLTSTGQYTVQVNTGVSPPQYATVTQTGHNNNGQQTVYLTTDYITYRDYYSAAPAAQTVATTSDQYQTVRQQLTTPAVTYAAQGSDGSVSTGDGSFLDRYLRQAPVSASSNGNYKGAATIHGGLTVDLPSPDSGIGAEANITPRPENNNGGSNIQQAQTTTIQLPVSASVILDTSGNATLATTGPATPGSTGSNSNASTPTTSASSGKTGSRRSWHEYGRNSEVDKVQIPKIFSDVGFKYYLESPISTSQRREDDRITYINKGQFYGITLEYIPDPDRPLKSATVKSLMLLVFREEKSHEDEIKAWQFWHSRQHSIKQRILDADTKNSSGIIGPIEEVTHNSISFYWNPLEGPAKINIAVQCLSTDFSNQKGVKGLPLHLQIDTFDDIREGSLPINRGYCQIKVFCDKGAERKTRDEERRAAKRKLSATGNGRKKIEDMYHITTERSEFYTMSDILKPPVLFTPSEELEKQINAGEINFYTGQSGTDLSATGFETGTNSLPPIATTTPPLTNLTVVTTGGLDVKRELRPVAVAIDPLTASVEMAINPPPIKRVKIYPQDRVLIFAKQENEEVFHPLHLVPPSLVGLAVAIQNKYKLEAKNIRHIFKRCRKGITVQMDDDMVKHYSNEDTCLLEVHQVDEHTHDITLVEYDPN